MLGSPFLFLTSKKDLLSELGVVPYICNWFVYLLNHFKPPVSSFIFFSLSLLYSLKFLYERNKAICPRGFPLV